MRAKLITHVNSIRRHHLMLEIPQTDIKTTNKTVENLIVSNTLLKTSNLMSRMAKIKLDSRIYQPFTEGYVLHLLCDEQLKS